MARGWESKSVEQQQDEVASQRQAGEVLTPEQIAERQRRKGIELSRQRIFEQLKVATHPRHREMLEAALADLEKKLRGKSADR
jgi:hypothetical protein